jgi:hypothetical protein
MTGGVASATTEPLDPGSSVAPGEVAPGCAEITAVLDAEDSLVTAYIADDAVAVVETISGLPALGEAAAAAAPPEIADAVATWVEPLGMIPGVLEGIEGTVPTLESLGEVFSSLPPTPDSDAAGEDVRAWATENCGWETASVDPFADAPEPQECEILDPAVAASAAGIDVDTSDSDGGGDFNLGVFWTKSCSYGNGAIALSTFSFNDLDLVLDFYMENLIDDAGNPVGEVLDVDLGTLPASTLVTSLDGAITVSVFEATVPFSVGFHAEDVAPEAAVAAAEAVFAGLPTEVPPPPMSSEAP